MKRIPRNIATEYAFDRALPPALRVAPGESFVVETHDAATGFLTREGQSPLDRPHVKSWPPLANPLAGPIFVEGTNKGDLLGVRIERIVVDSQRSVTFTSLRGPARDSWKWREADTPWTHLLRHETGPSKTMEDGRVWFNDRISWPVAPFIGTIGVAPEREVLSSVLAQGIGGGNLDCRDMCPGNVFYVNAQNDGGLVFVGDVHACQGDTEFTGVAAETEAEVTLAIDVIPGKKIAFPRIETPKSLIALQNSRPLEHAITKAAFDLLDWLVEEHGMDRRESYLQLSVNPGVRVHVYQMLPETTLQYTVGVEFPRDSI
jgi:acetamidase/formamidase